MFSFTLNSYVELYPLLFVYRMASLEGGIFSKTNVAGSVGASVDHVSPLTTARSASSRGLWVNENTVPVTDFDSDAEDVGVEEGVKNESNQNEKELSRSTRPPQNPLNESSLHSVESPTDSSDPAGEVVETLLSRSMDNFMRSFRNRSQRSAMKANAG